MSLSSTKGIATRRTRSLPVLIEIFLSINSSLDRHQLGFTFATLKLNSSTSPLSLSSPVQYPRYIDLISTMAIMSTLTGWVAVIALGGGYYYYVKEKQSKPAAPAKQSSKPIEEVKVKKEKAPKKKPSPKPEKEDQATSASVYVDDGKDEIDNREFARQLSNIKSGITPTAKAKTEKKQKSVKQSKAQEKKPEKPVAESSDNATAPSSATGGDADDDQSSVNSPELKASTETSPVTVSTNFIFDTCLHLPIVCFAERRCFRYA